MRRRKKTNTFSQNQEPSAGRLYHSSVHRGLQRTLRREIRRTETAVSIKIEGGSLAPDGNKSFQHVNPMLGHSMGPFDDSNHAWMNFTSGFRAEGETAKLIISDWASDTEHGGEIGQELMFNFMEVQP